MSQKISWLDEERETTLLGLVRLVMGALLAVNAAKLAIALAQDGYFGDYFHLSVVPESWLPSKAVYASLLALECAAALAGSIGLCARPALLVASTIGLYLLCCDRLDYHNNRYLLHLLVFLLAFAPCDRAFRLGRRQRDEGRRKGPVWAQRLMQLQISLVYAASSVSKLLDADWRGGQVLLVRYQEGVAFASASGHALPGWIVSLLTSPGFASVTSKTAILGELFLAVGLWLARTRALALWIGVMLHLGIELAASVEIFSFVMWGAYLLFCVPELRERRLAYDPSRPASRVFANSVRRLDWLSRFQIFPAPTQPAPAWGLLATDRDGRSRDGFGALTLIARGIPLLFPLWLPLAALDAAFIARRSARAPG